MFNDNNWLLLPELSRTAAKGGTMFRHSVFVATESLGREKFRWIGTLWGYASTFSLSTLAKNECLSWRHGPAMAQVPTMHETMGETWAPRCRTHCFWPRAVEGHWALWLQQPLQLLQALHSYNNYKHYNTTSVSAHSAATAAATTATTTATAAAATTTTTATATAPFARQHRNFAKMSPKWALEGLST